ncbi:hypothetical protein DMO24_19035, partial [Modestobacter versicolor]
MRAAVLARRPPYCCWRGTADGSTRRAATGCGGPRLPAAGRLRWRLRALRAVPRGAAGPAPAGRP